MCLSSANIFPEHAVKQFEQVYLQLRSKEKRIFPDEEVAWLPDVPEGHIHHKEWAFRRKSTRKLIRYLLAKKRPVKILELGCGNGWLSFQLSQLPEAQVMGVDINCFELEQARRVFGDLPNLRFFHGCLSDLQDEKFDMIVFAASIQYFADLEAVIREALTRLHSGGEIHLIDSCFYYPNELTEARKRSKDYFISMGSEGMKQFYFHHTLDSLQPFKHSVLFNPRSMLNRLFAKHPFYWIRITG